MTFAARYEDAPRVWGVGRVVINGLVTPWPVSEADIDDEAASLAPRLASLGLGDGDLVLIVSLLSQAIHIVPFEKAAGRVGARYSSADATSFDAFRTVALVRQLRPAVVMGLDACVLDGIVELGHDVGEALGAVPAVVAIAPDAVARLRDAGLRPRGWLKLGPTSALQSLDDDAFEYDATRWHVDADGDQLVISSLVARLTPCDGLRTGVTGRVLEPGRLEIPAFVSASEPA